MCGRYVSVASRSDLVTVFGVSEPSSVEILDQGVTLPSWNVAPTQQVAIVVDERDKADGTVTRTAAAARWGLIPSWTREIKGPPLINARMETAGSKRSFRKAWTSRRAVVPARGYYEWQTGEDEQGRQRKQAFYLHPRPAAGTQVLAFAGLYEWWRRPEASEDDPARWLLSATILTTDAVGAAGEIHDRTPVLLPADRVDAWLDAGVTDARDVEQILSGLAPAELEVQPVGNEVGSVRNNGPELIDPLPTMTAQPIELSYA